MKKICNLILVDASGSMQSRISDVKGSLMKLFSDIKENKDFNFHNIICDFSDDFRVLLNSVNNTDLNTDIIDSYTTRGATALFDAIDKSFNLVPKGYDGVYVNIITDGEENSSKKVNKEQCKALISKAKENKWAVTFMGCDEKALDNAKDIGIVNTFAFQNTTEGYLAVNKMRSKSMDTFYCSVLSGNINTENLFDVNTTN